MPFFSICIPNFNYGNYISITIESVIKQTFHDFEIIVTDNASTDNSWDIIQKYAREDKRIKAYRNCFNVGFARNLQMSSEKAIGNYIIMLSSDDIMFPDALESYYKVIKRYNENLVLHSAVDVIDSKGNYENTNLRFINGIKDYYTSNLIEKDIDAEFIDGNIIETEGLEVLKSSILMGKTPAHFCATCYSRELWIQTGGYDLKYMSGPDTIFLFNVLAKGIKIIYIKKRLFGYRIHQSNQLSQDLRTGALKKQLDKYIFAFSVSNEFLSKVNLSKQEIEKSFIEIYCYREIYSYLKNGFWFRSLKIYFFALACYPKHCFFNKNFYIIFLLLLIGPLSSILLKLIKKINF